MKNYLLIGGSYGIGNTLASMLSSENNVYILSRSGESIPEKCNHISFDVQKDQLSDIHLPEVIDGFAYLPGSINLKPFGMLKVADFQTDLEINFLSMVKVVQEILPRMKQANNPSIVLFSTVAVSKGMPFHTSIAAAKGAIEGFAKALAAEYAPHLRVNVIAPSLTDTPLASKLLSNDKKKDLLAERHPLKRLGTPSDIAATARFLLSDESSWLSGQIIGVDGGMSTLTLNS